MQSQIDGAIALMDVKENVKVPQIEPSSMLDDVEVLKRGCAELEMDKAILEQTIELLKKPRRRPVGADESREGDGDRRLEE